MLIYEILVLQFIYVKAKYHSNKHSFITTSQVSTDGIAVLSKNKSKQNKTTQNMQNATIDHKLLTYLYIYNLKKKRFCKIQTV